MNPEALVKKIAKLESEQALLEFKVKALLAENADLKRRMFGPKSEKIDATQMYLAVEAEFQTDLLEQEEPPKEKTAELRPVHRGGGRRPHPANLPIERVVIDVPESEREGLEKIREDVTEEIDYRPSQFIRRQIVRPVYAPKNKDQAPVQALAPKRVIPGSGVGTGLIAHIVVSRFADHLPYFRLEQIAQRQGVRLDRQKMCTWMEHAAMLLKTVYDQIREEIRQSGYVQVDETPIQVMDPEKEGSTRKGWLWAYHAPTAESLVFDFNMSRGQESPRGFFPEDWAGVAQTDGYSVYPAVFEGNARVEHAGCMAHARRMWVKAMDSGDVEAVPVLAEIQKLYRLEAEMKEAGVAEREAVRLQKSASILVNLNRLCQKASLEALPASVTGKAASYMLERWAALELFATAGKGHIQIDNNPVERGIRPSALGRKNWLFLGSPNAGWRTAVLYSVLGSCRLAKVNPYNYLVWVLNHLAAGTTATVGLVTPKAYKAIKEQA